MSEIIELKELNPSLLDELESIEKEIFSKSGFNRFSIPIFTSWGRYYLLIKDGQKTAGVQVIRAYEEEHSVYIAGFWVKEKMRSKGLGSELLNHVIDRLRNDGIDKLYLTVSPENKEAVEFYKKAGFSIISLHKDYYGKSEDRYIMKMVLSNSES